MSNTNNKPRLADVAKKNTTDRASKLASAFLPQPAAPVQTPPAAEEETRITPAAPLPDAATSEPDPIQVQATPPVADELVETPTGDVPDAIPAVRSKERKSRSTSSINLQDLIGQPVPDNLRCVKPIMLSEEQHQLLRDLNYRYKKPMTSILYNLLEIVNQAYQRELKGDQSNA